MTDYKQLCAKLIELWDADCDIEPEVNELRRALAEFQPESPTDKQLSDTYWDAYHRAPERSNGSAHAYALRAVLAHWGS